MLSVADSLVALAAARSAEKISPSAADNVRLWLTDPSYAEFVPHVIEHVEQARWAVLNDVFWTTIPFGTAGRRGPMYPIGTAAINDRTIGESAQGLADFVRQKLGEGAELRCAIAYDTRHRSRHFAELCAEVMAAAGVQGVLSRRASQHAGIVVHRPGEELPLRHHGQRQPQSAARQRRQGVRTDRGTIAPAGRRGRDALRRKLPRRFAAFRLPRRGVQGMSNSAKRKWIAAIGRLFSGNRLRARAT